MLRDRGNYYRGDLVWIQGPYPDGRFNDIAIFNKVLRNFLEPSERVEADNGYVVTADKIKCPDNLCNPVENEGSPGDNQCMLQYVGDTPANVTPRHQTA